ncbi:MAG: hypothetical protein IPG63_13815 [Xanthomonadales bacterium]|nr:hypothetical protein [Xanthomonadales bacterium]MBK7146908.1 hypothetical protein [Xanthomonadales bacterium]MCC6559954.1 hypothetical protein [Xanthomonadales bacterium]
MRLPVEFARFVSAFKQGRHLDALTSIDALIGAHPKAAALHWHRANCLEALERYTEMAPELDRLLALQPDYVPAIVKRVRFADIGCDEFDACAEDLPSSERARRDRDHAARAAAHSRRNEADLRRALQIDPNHVEALHLLSNVLRYREPGRSEHAEADALLARAIEIAPMRVELLDARATLLRSSALRRDDGPDDSDTVKTFSGMRFSRSKLEAALDDYDTCYALSGEYVYALRMGTLLHDLGRYAEALQHYDMALDKLEPEDAKRELILDMRARSENNGAGEREQMAKLIESAVVGDGRDRSLGDDVAAQALFGAANAIRAGRAVGEALDARMSEDPDTLLATSIAQQILNVAHEPPPQLEAVAAADYPAYQRRFVDHVAGEAGALGLRPIGDAEAKGLFPILGQRVLLRFFADDSGEIGIASFALKPKWPGILGFLWLLLTGKWRVATMVECVSQFDDGTHLSTQYENPSPFEYGDRIDIERLPRKTPIRDLLARHIARVARFKLQHPTNVAMVADDLDGMELRWREGQRVKCDYRTSIGYVTESELKRLLGAQHERFGDKVRTQLAMLAEDLADQD